MKEYAVVGMLETTQEQLLMKLKEKQKISTTPLRKKLKLSPHEFRQPMAQLLKKGLVKNTPNPLNKRTKLYYLSQKGVKIKGFINGN